MWTSFRTPSILSWSREFSSSEHQIPLLEDTTAAMSTIKPALAVPPADNNAIKDQDDIEMIEAVPRPSISRNPRSNHKLDAAAELLRKVGGDASDRINITPADDKRVLRRIDTVLRI